MNYKMFEARIREMGFDYKQDRNTIYIGDPKIRRVVAVVPTDTSGWHHILEIAEEELAPSVLKTLKETCKLMSDVKLEDR